MEKANCDLTDIELFVTLADYKKLEQQLQAYKDKEDILLSDYDLLKREYIKLKQQKQDLKEWLEEEIKTLDILYENLTDAGAVKKNTLKEVLERLGNMKLEIGMFIRTKDGMIYKNYGDGTNFFGDTVIYVNGENNLYDSVINVDIKKASFNLIDLIEAGDYVNCEYMLEHYLQHDRIEHTYNGYWYEQDIKSILTHEQYEANCYKVGE